MKKFKIFLSTLLFSSIVNANTNAFDMMNDGFNTMQNTLNNIDKRKEAEKQRQHDLEIQRRQLAHENEVARQKQMLRQQEQASLKAQQKQTQHNQQSQQQSKVVFWNSNGWVQTKSSNEHLFVMIHREPIKQVVFLLGDNSCKANSPQLIPALPMYVNDKLVDLSSRCSKQGEKMYWAASESDRNILTDEFKRSTNVVLESNNKFSAVVFSAKGFINQWNR